MKIFRTSTVPISLNVLLKGQLKFLNQYFEIVCVSGEGKDLDEMKEREGVETFPIEMERKISPFKDFISLIKLYFLFLKEKPQIVHSITPKAGLLTMLAGKMAGVPIRMHTFTGLIFPTKKGFVQKLLIKTDQLLCWSATNIYPEGKGVKEDLIKYKITSKYLKVLANGNVNGIDLDFFSKNKINLTEQNTLKNELNIHNNDFVFIFVGRLVSDKGINELIEAFSNIKESNVKLILVGPLESELDPLLPQTLIEITNNQNIISVGFQKDVRPYLALANVFVFPSYREGFPNVVMQAGAMELPSIVSDINGCNEIIIEGVNGTIIPAKNSDEILKAMLKLLSDNNYCNALKNNARSMIQSRYEQSVVWNALLNEYEVLISKQQN